MINVHSFLYRCAENATGTEWSLITPTTGDLSAIKYDVVENSQSVGYGTKSFIDNFAELQTPPIGSACRFYNGAFI